MEACTQAHTYTDKHTRPKFTHSSLSLSETHTHTHTHTSFPPMCVHTFSYTCLPHITHTNAHFVAVIVQSPSRIRLFATPWTASRQVSLTLSISQSLLKFISIESVMPSNHLILCHPLLLLPSTFPGIRVFSNELALHTRWPKYWSFSFSISPSKEYSGLIAFKIDWFDLLAVQGTLRSLLQHHSSKASVQCSTFFAIFQ